MAKALEPAVTTDEIVFELERFERSEGRLRLTGRWFGVRGRRFVRPTLTLDQEGGRVRALADLDDKPWPAEDGQPWTASFPWADAGRVAASELSVAPDIAIQLPAPSSRRTRSERLSALPRREAMTASWGDFPGLAADRHPAEDLLDPSPVAQTETPEPEAPDRLVALGALRTELADAAAELERTAAELEATTAELEATTAELEATTAELDAVRGDVATARSAREAALRSAAQAEAQREAALTRAVQAEEERDAVAAERAELMARYERTRAALERLTRERDQALASRGAALVMRGATRALPAYEHHVGWWRRGLAVVVLIGVILAALIVLHAL